jgi:transketolase C-terminal domain/subunit
MQVLCARYLKIDGCKYKRSLDMKVVELTAVNPCDQNIVIKPSSCRSPKVEALGTRA